MAVHAESSIQLNTIPAYTSLLGGHFVYRANGTQTTPASANIIESSKYLDNPAQWKYNTHIGSNGIKLRYNEIDLSTWSASNGLQLYYPVINNGIIISSQLGAQFTAEGLNFYKPSNEIIAPSASLTSEGLNVLEGSIKLGEEKIEYFISHDREVDENKIYYEKRENDYIEIENPTGIPKTQNFYEKRPTTHLFEVTNDGYIGAQAGWIGGINSYVRLEKDVNTNTHYLDVRLSQLDMLLNGDLYGQENVVDVLDIVSQQVGFIQLWEGEQVWLYYKDGEGTEPYIIHQYTNNDTGEISYYYDENEHLLPYTKSIDETVDTTKQYYTQRATKVVDINVDLDPSSLDYYEKSGNIYIPTTDTTVITGKDYYEVEYVEVTFPSGNPKNNNYYEDTPESWQSINSIYFQSSDTEVNSNKTYYIIDNNDYIIVENPTGNPSEQSYYEMLPFIDMAGLSQSLKFTDDSLHNQQKLIVSSANNSEDEKVRVEIDPQYLKFLVESDNNSSLEMNLNYDSILNTNSLTINSGKEQIFSIEDSNDYALSTTTGFKAGLLSMFHYKNGLAIGFM